MTGRATALCVSAGSTHGLWGLLPFVARNKSGFVLTAVCGILAQLSMISALAAGGWIAGLAASGATADALRPACIMMIVLVGIAAVTRWLQSYAGHDFAFGLVEALQVGVFDGIERAAPGYILGRRTGDLASVASSDAELMEWFYAHLLGDYVGAILAPAAALAVIATVHPALALAVLPFVPLIASVPFWLARRAGEQGEALRAALGQLNAETIETIQGLREIALFGADRQTLERLARRTQALQAHQLRYGSRSGLEQAAIDVLLGLAIGATLLTGAALLARGALDIGELTFVVVLAIAALVPITQVTEIARRLGEIRAGARRVLTVLHQKQQVADASGMANTEACLEPQVRFERVRFSYERGGDSVLRSVDLQLTPGTTTALVGASGAGKSTCVNLLMRFWDVSDGAISIGGRDIRAIPLRTLRTLVAMVPQDVHLFSMSIEDNIRLGRPETTFDEVQRAARLAQADHFIRNLPEGYATFCGERGTRLSGGQRQLIAIARALLRDAPILILDEAVANLDAENQRAVEAAMRAASRGRTTLVIAHRASTIRSADRILVLDEGRIMEQGRHEELLGRGGPYARLLATLHGDAG